MSETKVSQELWNNYEDYYKDGDSEWRRIGAVAKADNIIALCRDLPLNSILEIGAGEGSILQRLSELNFGKELFALDISPSGVAAIKNKKIPRLTECSLFDGVQLPHQNDRFDLVIMSHVVEHLEHPRQLLYEAARVAKFIFIEVPLEDTIRLPRDFVFNTVGHLNFYTAKTIRQLVQSCGLRVRGEIITNPPKGAYKFQKGNRGLVNFHIKQALLKIAPAVATEIFTYHGSLLCERENGK